MIDDLTSMRPLAEFRLADRQRVVAVLTDIDDTLTEGGRLPASSYAAMERLRASGRLVIPVTGRPAGWCDMIARQWPVDAVVGENGAFYFRYDPQERRMHRVYAKPLTERIEDRARLDAIRNDVLREVPGSAVSADQPYREADLAIDFCEDVPPLGQDDIRRIVATFARHGATAKVSSIHVNGWFGGYDKLTTSAKLLREAFGIAVETMLERIVFAGDSPNDAPMFAYFPNAVGVANVRHYPGQFAANPRWVTNADSAAGFTELADSLMALS
jgi:HAD superfamily hydrolase (TIGR01484 family)